MTERLTVRSGVPKSAAMVGTLCARPSLHVRAMKEEAETWRSRSPLERQAELEAEALGVPYEGVLRRLEEELR